MLTLWALHCVFLSSAAAPEGLLLDVPGVIARVKSHHPALAVAVARVAEADALRVGARAPAPSNPELALSAGPGWQTSRPSTMFTVSLTWPIDVSGSPQARFDTAQARGDVARAEADDVERRAVGEALDLRLQVLTAVAAVQIEAQRRDDDAVLLRVADVRRKTGTVGDGDVMLARVLCAESMARWHGAEGHRDALTAVLRGKLGIPSDVALTLGAAEPGDVPPLDVLLPALQNRPDLRRSAAQRRWAAAERNLQERAGWPVPKLSAGGGRAPEYVAEIGVDVPLPVYQRNQTATAVAAAYEQTALHEDESVQAAAEAEARSAWARYAAARSAFAALSEAEPAIADAEHLAARSYELGQAPLSTVITVRREIANARLARLDAQLTLCRAALAVRQAAGEIR